MCSIDDCDGRRLARGWCRKHYSRWLNHGDPLALSERLKGDPLAPVKSLRLIQGRQVYVTVDGRAFVEIRRRRNDAITTQRRYGQLLICERCEKESFVQDSGRVPRFCSHKCAGPAMGAAKLGRTRTTSKKSRIDYLDRIFSILIRADGECVHCGTTERLQCAHGFSRRYRSVRWDTRNAFCLCQRCHMFFTHRPLEWDEWLKDRWGEDLYDEVRAAALGIKKVDLDSVREELVAEILRRGITANQLPKTASGWAS